MKKALTTSGTASRDEKDLLRRGKDFDFTGFRFGA
jgi:hypothetical protein